MLLRHRQSSACTLALLALQSKIREKVGTNELLPICSRPLFWPKSGRNWDEFSRET